MGVAAPAPRLVVGSRPPIAQNAGRGGVGRDGFAQVGAPAGGGRDGYGGQRERNAGFGYGGRGYGGLNYGGLNYGGLGDNAPALAGVGLTPPVYGAPYGGVGQPGGEPIIIQAPRPCAAPLIIKIGNSLHAATTRVVYGAPPCGF